MFDEVHASDSGGRSGRTSLLFSSQRDAAPRSEPSQGPICRHTADKTPRHDSSRLGTTQHRASPEPWTVQHNCVWLTTAEHGQLTSAKPPSSVRLRSPPPITLLHIGTFLLRFEAHHCPNADILPTRLPATRGDRATRASTRDDEGALRMNAPGDEHLQSSGVHESGSIPKGPRGRARAQALGRVSLASPRVSLDALLP